MGVDVDYVEAVNKIILAGYGSSVEKEAEDSDMKPGMLVQKGSSDKEVLMGTEATKNYGWVGYENTPAMWKPATIDTAYTAGDQISVISGPGMVLRALLAAGQGGGGTDVKKGDKLVGTSGGALKKWVPVVDTDSSGTTQEMIEATAMEDARANTAGYIIVRSLI